MTITVDAVHRKVQYTSTGSLGPYSFSFKVLAATDIKVSVNDTLKTLSSHYTTTYNTDGTGSVTFTSGNAPASSALVTIESDQAIARTTDYSTGGDFTAASINDALDRLTINDQQIETFLSRNVQLSGTTGRTTSGTGTNGPLFWPYDATPSNNASKVVAYDSNGTALELGPSSSEIAGAGTHAQTASDKAAEATASASCASSSASAASDSASVAQSAATAASSGQIYTTVVNQSAATLSPALSANGTYYLCDTQSNDITVTLPAIGTSEGFKYAFQKTHANNNLIFQRSGSDTLNGSASNITLTDVDSNIIFVSDNNTTDNWVGTLLSQITDGSGLTKTGSVLSIDLTQDQAWTGSQRSTPVTDNDGSFDMNAGNNFNWTPTGADVIEFTNETAGQGGLIYLVNGSGHTITKGSEVKCDANFLATVSAAGNYLISYYSFDGTSVVVENTLAVS